MPDLTMEQLTLAAAIAAGVALLALLIALATLFRLRRVRREYKVLLGNGDRDVVAAVQDAVVSVRAMESRVDSMVQAHEEQAAKGRYALQKFHMVRYDAFDDMGGRLSFSAALLDDHGDGVVLTSINGRTETRTYAKPVRNLRSDHNLSEEEREAIAGAVAGYNRGELTGPAPR